MDYDKLTRVMRQLALEAGDEIMEIYNSDDFEVRVKSDESPVTAADEAADAIIAAGLRAEFPAVALVTEEQFGPALPIIRYTDLDDAVAEANRSEAGLGGSVWSADPVAAREVAARLEAGTVWINNHGAVDPRIPFGGVKGSGYGLEFGVEGLKSVCVPVVLTR